MFHYIRAMRDFERKEHSDLVGRNVVGFLNSEFLSRCEKNDRYSLRAFAKSLSIDPTLLSRLMKGQRKPNKRMVKRLVEELDPDVEVLNAIYLKKLESKNSEVILGEDKLRPIAKWYFFAILDLFLIDGFRFDPEWMSIRLGLKMNIGNKR